MAKATLSLPILPLVLLFLFFNFAGILKLANGQPGKTWCIAKPSATDAELAENRNFACSNVNGGCSIIEEGGSCYLPNTSISRASVAMNLYYQLKGRNAWNCDFKGSGVTTTTDPSYGSCKYT